MNAWVGSRDEEESQLKVFIVTDLEGVCGVVLEDQVLPGGPEYEATRMLLTEETNSAVDGAFKAGADLVRVLDGHLNGFNFVIDRLDPRAEYIMGSAPKWWEGNLDSSFDALFLIGYHSKAGTPKGVYSHTWVHAGLSRHGARFVHPGRARQLIN